MLGKPSLSKSPSVGLPGGTPTGAVPPRVVGYSWASAKPSLLESSLSGSPAHCLPPAANVVISSLSLMPSPSVSASSALVPRQLSCKSLKPSASVSAPVPEPHEEIGDWRLEI